MSLANTSHKRAEAAALISYARRVFFIGIGGVHMAALAELSLARGMEVCGSDRAKNRQTERLASLGVQVTVGHHAESVVGSDLVVYTLAISSDNPEYRAAVALGIPLFSRADYLGALMMDYPRRIGIAGSHGKSTVTAMLGDIFAAASRAPTVLCGAVMRRTGSTAEIGEGEDFIFEACEYGNSFLHLPPTLAVVLNVELDHVDFFADRAALLGSFCKFVGMASACALLPFGERELTDAATSAGVPAVTFGADARADYYMKDATLSGGGGSFLLCTPSGTLGKIVLRVPGAHNLQNALAAATVGVLSGIPFDVIASALLDFRGAARRLEYRGVLCGAEVFDDYAHHPTELRASIAAARALGGGKLVVIFQPHTFSRTAAFLDDLADALSEADRVLLVDIYAAREENKWGVTSKTLAEAVGDKACYCGSVERAAEIVRGELAAGDLLLVMGAGDVDRIFGEFFGKGFTL